MNVLHQYIRENFEQAEFVEGFYPTYRKIKDHIDSLSNPQEAYDSWRKVKKIFDQVIGMLQLYKDEYYEDESKQEIWDGTLNDFRALQRKHAEMANNARNYLLAQGYEL